MNPYREKNLSNKIRTTRDHSQKQFGPEVDRLQSILSSVKPCTTAQIKDSALMSECFRIIEIIKKMNWPNHYNPF